MGKREKHKDEPDKGERRDNLIGESRFNPTNNSRKAIRGNKTQATDSIDTEIKRVTALQIYLILAGDSKQSSIL